MRHPRYTTFRDEELLAAIRSFVPPGQNLPDVATLRQQAKGQAARNQDGSSAPMRLIKEHRCMVSYPDGAKGTCLYRRDGPRWHLFQYRHLSHSEEAQPQEELSPTQRLLPGVALPPQRFDQRLGNGLVDIEEKARELATSAFGAAIRQEWLDRFRRATPPFGQKPDSASFQLSVKRAREIGGKYALCHRLGSKLLPASPLFDCLDEVNAAYEAANNPQLAVACACRWTRRWEIPRFNPLYGEHSDLKGGSY